MHESTDTLAREMTAFCKERSEKRASRPERPPIAEAVLGVVIVALLIQIPFMSNWGRAPD